MNYRLFMGALLLIYTSAIPASTKIWEHLLPKRSIPMVQPLTETILQSQKPIIIKAFASWCPYCTKMKPIFEKVANELGAKYTFAEFDIEQFPAFTKQFTIASLPTFVFIKNKTEAGREVGAMSGENLKKLIVQYLG